jgi:hypothetical protein
MIKVKQKVSVHCTTSGAETFCAIRSYISTVRKQLRNVIGAIFDALSGQPFIPPTLLTQDARVVIANESQEDVMDSEESAVSESMDESEAAGEDLSIERWEKIWASELARLTETELA